MCAVVGVPRMVSLADDLIRPADVGGDIAQHLIRVGIARILHRSQHPQRRGVMRLQLLLPIGKVSPRRQGEELALRRRQRVGIDE
jgi:hypothetical protein